MEVIHIFIQEERNLWLNKKYTAAPRKYDYLKVGNLTDTFVVLDFETTGFRPLENEIIQYGLVEYKNGRIIDEKSQYIKPEFGIPQKITSITGISDSTVRNSPGIEEVIEELYCSLKDRIIVAHNAAFDMKFLLQNLAETNIEHERFGVIDTLSFARRYIRNVPNHKLPTLKKIFDLDSGHSHDALNDCRATGKLALLLYEKSLKEF